MVSGSSGAGYRNGDHGIWRRGDDWGAAVDQIDGVFQVGRGSWRRKNVPGDGNDLFYFHDVWRVYDSRAEGRVEAGGMDGAGEAERDDHDAQRGCEHGLRDAAVLAVVGGAVHERDGWNRDYRAG